MAGHIPVPIESRFIPSANDPKDYLTFSGDLDALIQQALECIIAETPPLTTYSAAQCRGLFRGPTSLAYLFLKLDIKYPSLRIQDQSPGYWAQRYMDAERTGADSAPCGLACESAAYWAVKTMMDDANASRFCEEMDRMASEEDHPHELLFGYAGLLYMIRAVESWRPEATRSLKTIKARMVEKVLGAGPGWVWRGKRYIGAREDGNWTTKDDDDIHYEGLVQFCHGAPGFVASLLHIRRLFPEFLDRIDNGIELGRQAIWKYGLLRKDPCICHGILGNAMMLSSGPRRDHFLAWSLPMKLTEERGDDNTTFPEEDAGKMSTWFNYWPGAAWAWSEYHSETPGVILYTDV